MATEHSAYFNIDNSRSYATEAELEKGLKRFGFADEHYIVVCNRKGRFTAIFPASNVLGEWAAKNNPNIAGNLTRYSRRGFMTIG